MRLPFGKGFPALLLDFHTCDVFTDRRFAGNPQAIMPGADDLTPMQMQSFRADLTAIATHARDTIEAPVPFARKT